MPAAGLIRLRFTLDGQAVAVQCQAGTRLLDLLRGEFQRTSVREGCGRGECGSCLVLMDGLAVNSCLVPAFMLADSEIVTADGLLAVYPDLRRALARFDTSGCGFCDAGQQIALAALLLSDPEPTEEEVRRALSGNLCGCGLQVASLARGSAAESDRRAGSAEPRKRHGRR